MQFVKRFLPAALLSVLVVRPGVAAPEQGGKVVARSVAVDQQKAPVTFELEDGTELVFRLSDGKITLNGNTIAEYRTGGALDRDLRLTLREAGRMSSGELLAALRELGRDSLTAAETAAVESLVISLSPLSVADQTVDVADAPVDDVSDAARTAAAGAVESAGRVTERVGRALGRAGIQLQDLGELDDFDIDNATVYLGNLMVDRDRVIDGGVLVVKGDATVRGQIKGDLVTLDGSIVLERGSEVDGDVVAVNGRIERRGAIVGGTVRTITRGGRSSNVSGGRPFGVPVGEGLATLLGLFVSLASIGFGMNFFAPQQLSAVSDTVSSSFGKSFLAGLLAQPLLLPVLVMIVAGLAVTVVGILLIPFALLGFALAVAATGVGGYLAVARVVGENYRRRRFGITDANAEYTQYKSVFIGLIGLLLIWLPAVVLGWIPVAGAVFAALAAIFTWIMMTAGFGAAIISRGGIRTFFPRRRTVDSVDPFVTGELSGSYMRERR